MKRFVNDPQKHPDTPRQSINIQSSFGLVWDFLVDRGHLIRIIYELSKSGQEWCAQIMCATVTQLVE
jgi:hypothetical protein